MKNICLKLRVILVPIILFILSPYGSYAQTTVPGASISGKVMDAKTKKAFEFVSISILRAKDSTFVKGQLSTASGDFSLANVVVGDYLLKASHVGYKSIWKPLSVKTSQAIDIGSILLEEGILLNEITIEGEPIAVKIKEDTTTYNAAAYKTRPDAVVEDALKKLPGVEVERNGTIKSEGEVVKKVTVDGKDFFGNDPKIATKNLPADAVKEYQMINDKTEKAKTTGIDDGIREKTLNIVLKEDKKNGWFGSGSVAGGTRERYLGSMNLNRFTKDKQFNVLMTSNNVNQTNAGVEEVDIVLSGLNRAGSGLTTSNSGGLNYTDAWGRKNQVNFSGSYTASRSSTAIESQTDVQSTQVSGNFIDNNSSNTDRSSQSHRFSGRMSVKIDSLTTLSIVPAVTLSSNHSMGSSIFSKNTTGLQPVNAGFRTSDNDGFTPSLTATISLSRKLKQKKGALSLYMYGYRSDNNSDNITTSQNRFFQGGRQPININWLEEQESMYYSYSVYPSISRIFGPKKISTLSFSPYISLFKSTGDRNTLEYNPSTGLYENRLDSLSNLALTTNTQTGIQSSFNRSGKKVGLYFTLGLSNINLDGSIRNNTYFDQASKNYLMINPSGQIIFRLQTRRALQFNMSASNGLPSINDLLVKQNNTNPLYITEGNPDLKLSNTYTGSIRYSNSDIKKNTSTILSFNYSKTYNALSRSVFFDDETGITTSKRLNLDGAYRMSATGSFTLATKVKGLKISPGLGFNNSRNVNLQNGRKNNSDQIGGSGNITLSYFYKEMFNLTLTNRTTYSHVNNSVQATLTNNFVIMDNSADISLEPVKKWRFNTDITHRSQASQSFVLINTGLQRYFMDKNKLSMELRCFDLLNRNKDIFRTISDNEIRDSRSNNLRQYFYMKLTYKVNKAGTPARTTPPPPGVSGY